MTVSVSQVYTSVGCNRTPEIIDWNNDGIICFGAKNAVVIYDTVRNYNYLLHLFKLISNKNP